jgi:hypothetical protein
LNLYTIFERRIVNFHFEENLDLINSKVNHHKLLLNLMRKRTFGLIGGSFIFFFALVKYHSMKPIPQDCNKFISLNVQ